MLWSIHNWLPRLKQYIRYVSVDAVFPVCRRLYRSYPVHTHVTVHDVLRHRQGPTFQRRMKCGAAPDGAALDAHSRDSGLISFWCFFFFLAAPAPQTGGAPADGAARPCWRWEKKIKNCTTSTEQSYVRVKGKDGVELGRRGLVSQV